MTPTSYIFRSLIQIQGSRLSGLFNVAEQLARLSGVCERSETGVGKHQDGRDAFVTEHNCFWADVLGVLVGCGAFSPGLTVITVLEKTVAAMPLRKASKAIFASDIKSTREFEIRQTDWSCSCHLLSSAYLLYSAQFSIYSI